MSTDEFEAFCAAQQLRIAQALAPLSPAQRARRIAERPTKAEIMQHGHTESRGITFHASGEKKHGCR